MIAVLVDIEASSPGIKDAMFKSSFDRSGESLVNKLPLSPVARKRPGAEMLFVY